MSGRISDGSVTRRKILRTAGTASIVGTGLAASAGSSAARTGSDPELRELEDEYDSEQAIRRAIDDHASGVLRSLAEHDVIDEASASSLPIGQSIDVEEVESSSDDGVAVTSFTEGGESTGFIAVSQSTDDHDLSLYVQPERERAYAYVEDDSNTRLFQSDSSDDDPAASAESGSVTTLQECDQVCYEARCTSESCYYFWNVGIDYRCCVDSDGSEVCNRTGTSGCQCGNRVCE